ncbi:uncharacterized protein LOC135015880 [Pseudophryne corroboree]|uniref:uncharacterized protein LOC135015880 n=1 Tax=Pseudophryne corroboree TaxID=495146 RepID=UPI00308210DD
MGMLSSSTTHKRKSKIWSVIAKKVSTEGVRIRTIENCKKRWRDCKKITKDKMARLARHTKGTGGGSSLDINFNQWEEKIRNHFNPVLVEGVEGGVDSAEAVLATTLASRASGEQPGQSSILQRAPTATASAKRTSATSQNIWKKKQVELHGKSQAKDVGVASAIRQPVAVNPVRLLPAAPPASESAPTGPPASILTKAQRKTSSNPDVMVQMETSLDTSSVMVQRQEIVHLPYQGTMHTDNVAISQPPPAHIPDMGPMSEGSGIVDQPQQTSTTSSIHSEDHVQAEMPTTPFDNIAEVAREMDSNHESHRRKMEGSMIFLAQCVDRLADNVEESSKERRAKENLTEIQHTQIIDGLNNINGTLCQINTLLTQSSSTSISMATSLAVIADELRRSHVTISDFPSPFLSNTPQETYVPRPTPSSIRVSHAQQEGTASSLRRRLMDEQEGHQHTQEHM